MAIDSWTNLILPRLPGATKTLVEEEIKKTVDLFCRNSAAYRRMVYGYHVTAGDREVTLQIDDGTVDKVCQVLRIYYERRQLTQYSHVPWEISTDVPRGYTVKPQTTDVILLSTIPSRDLTDVLDAWVALVPLDIENNDNQLLEQDFFEAIFDGALGRMYAQNNKPYSDQKLGVYHLSRYRNELRKARDMANRGFTGNAQNWTFPSFGR